ncbi:MAG: LysR substrate-binding domain-containing protein [Paracoccus sp. (in: a-proteobacteria)]
MRLFVMAAERLNISAAGRELGGELLRPAIRKVSLSLEGSDLLPYAQGTLAQADAARAVLGGADVSPKGVLCFAAPSSFAQLHVMPLLPDFQARYPDLTLDLRPSDLRLDAIEGSFDLALRSAPLANSSLKGRKLADDTRVLCASPDYLARHGVPQVPAIWQGTVSWHGPIPTRVS